MRPSFQFLVFSAGLVLATGCATRSEFEQLYDHYFPKRSVYVERVYRKSFDETLFGPPPPEGKSSRMGQVYYAFHGDDSAFHAFVHHPDQDRGHYGEEWVYECVVLLLKLGDDHFSRLLALEDRTTREKVGVAIDTRIDFKKHHFPKTRALYHFRWGPREPQSPD
ncbi:MAG TPA: hypothetical protein VGW39_00090 [Chthoniobacterales bacterium]|nr:hypothetical protein [Chthoniobacterales bacterium]